MRLILHGGQCCGFKCIYDLGYCPTETVPAKRKTKKLQNEGDAYYSSPKSFFWESAPEETKGKRLDRLLEFLDEYRPQGICEIILADWQLVAWRPFLLERGFKEVNKCKNSNSGNTIHVFHRNKEN